MDKEVMFSILGFLVLVSGTILVFNENNFTNGLVKLVATFSVFGILMYLMIRGKSKRVIGE
ncbi:MAG: hypothetical protein QW228_03050 [Candidatus Aenigmatarchaeota archaeon]